MSEVLVPTDAGSTMREAIDPERFRDVVAAIEGEVGRLMVGQHDTIRLVLIALIGGGHVLLDGVPGLGKTVLVRSLASTLNQQFARVQFTPDLMPADITGSHIVTEDDDGHRRFEFQPGPLFTNMLLADEINRATPKTQSGLLEAMQERQVTAGNQTWPLSSPFFVLATQNPIELEGTYPLPEAQLDRFFFKLVLAFPSAGELAEIALRTTGVEAMDLKPVATGADLEAMALLSRQVPIARPVLDYACAVVLATHPTHPEAPQDVRRYVRWGSSPRGLQTLVTAARTRALLDGRFNVAGEDIAALAVPALRHRIFLNFEADANGIEGEAIVNAAVASVKRV
ncbi:MAG: MoxR family ATPase [Actinomycetota bacterium]|nr:MoxR family ATPase [Actinomycetota bacterium]